MAEFDDTETLRRFFAPHGRLRTMPTGHVKRRLVLDRTPDRWCRNPR